MNKIVRMCRFKNFPADIGNETKRITTDNKISPRVSQWFSVAKKKTNIGHFTNWN